MLERNLALKLSHSVKDVDQLSSCVVQQRECAVFLGDDLKGSEHHVHHEVLDSLDLPSSPVMELAAPYLTVDDVISISVYQTTMGVILFPTTISHPDIAVAVDLRVLRCGVFVESLVRNDLRSELVHSTEVFCRITYEIIVILGELVETSLGFRILDVILLALQEVLVSSRVIRVNPVGDTTTLVLRVGSLGSFVERTCNILLVVGL